MSLITEDGTGRADAESYISVAGADSYHASFGATAWADLTNDAKEQALRRATAYMGQMYRSRWKGWRTNTTQALDWPRQGVLVSDMPIAYTLMHDELPVEVTRVCADLALKAATSTLVPDQTRGVLSETVGPISVTYDPRSPQQPQYVSIDLALRPYLRASGAMVSIGRC